jgi:hypothetical protein
MAIQGEYRIAASQQKVWEALNDPAVLQACVPGCESLQMLSATDIEARVVAQLGPVKAAFTTKIVLSDLNPPSGYTLTGEGKAAVGFGKGSASVRLVQEGGTTVLSYTATLSLGGKLAQVGSRLVESATRQLADQFFDAFAKHMDAGATAIPAEETAGARASGARHFSWRSRLAIAGIVAAIVAAYWYCIR